LNDTLAVNVQGNRLIIRQVTDDFSLQPTAVTGKREFFLLGFNRDATVTITQSEPLPLRLLGMAMEVSI
jgi:Fe2+ transport system protein FeoA